MSRANSGSRSSSRSPPTRTRDRIPGPVGRAHARRVRPDRPRRALLVPDAPGAEPRGERRPHRALPEAAPGGRHATPRRHRPHGTCRAAHDRAGGRRPGHDRSRDRRGVGPRSRRRTGTRTARAARPDRIAATGATRPAPDRERRTPPPSEGHGHARGGMGPRAARGPRQPARHRRRRRSALLSTSASSSTSSRPIVPDRRARRRRAAASRPSRQRRRSPLDRRSQVRAARSQRAGRDLRVREHQGGVRDRFARGHGDRTLRRRTRRRRAGDVRRAGRDRRAHRDLGCDATPRGARLGPDRPSRPSPTTPEPIGHGRWCGTASRSSGCPWPSARCIAASRATRRHCSSRSTPPDDPPRHQPRLRVPPPAAGDPRDRVAGPWSSAWSSPPDRRRPTSSPDSGSSAAISGSVAARIPVSSRRSEQPADEGDSLRGFFEATRRGAVPTLSYQAAERLTDLMWRPVEAARATQRIVDAVSPDAIIVDHLAFSARLGLSTAGIPHGDIVLGHPTALPVGSEVYGFPPAWPDAFRPDSGELDELLRLCRRVSARFTEEWNRAARELRPDADAELATRSPSMVRSCSTTTPRSSPTSGVVPSCRRTASWARRAASSRRTPRSRPGWPRPVRSST